MKYQSYNVVQLQKRKGKPWQARLKYKDGVTGKWREVTKMLPEAKGKREATKLAKVWFDEMNQAAENSPNIAADKTVEDMYNQFLEFQFTTGQIEKSSYTNQKYIFKRYAKPYIGEYIFANFDRDAVSNWLTKLNAQGYKQDTIYNIFAAVRKVFIYYYNIGELMRNPFAGIKAPKQNKRTTHLTPEQMDDVLTAVYANYLPEDEIYIATLLAFYGGLRRGEICGLKWNNVNLETGMISIENAVGMAGSEAYTKQPKNKSSIRTFPMVAQLVAVLAGVKEAKKPAPQDFVLGGKEFISPSKLDNDFRDFAVANELKDAYGKYITLHGLRHNLGFVGIKSGMDISSLSKMFGHSSRAMTLDTYGDSSPDALKVAATKLEDKFDNDTENFKRIDLEPEYFPEEEK